MPTATRLRATILNCTRANARACAAARGIHIALSRCIELARGQLEKQKQTTREPRSLTVREIEMEFLMWLMHTCVIIWGS